MGNHSSQSNDVQCDKTNLARLQAAVKSRKLYPAGELGVHTQVHLTD